MLKRWIPYHKDWLHRKNDWKLDLTYYVLNYSIKLTVQFIFIWLAQSFALFHRFLVKAPSRIHILFYPYDCWFFLFFVDWQSHKYDFLWCLQSIYHSLERLYYLNVKSGMRFTRCWKAVRVFWYVWWLAHPTGCCQSFGTVGHQFSHAAY